jgi:hypothetical protein
MVVTCAEDLEVVRRRDGRGVRALRISRCESILGDRSFPDIIATLGADQETFVTECDVEGGGGALEQVGEQAGVDVGLLIEEVELAAVGSFSGQVVCEDFGLQALGDVVFEFEFGVEAVGGCPGLSQGETCSIPQTLDTGDLLRERTVSPVALSVYFPSIFPWPLTCDILNWSLVIVVLTEPEMGPSCADLPLTLKLREHDRVRNCLNPCGGSLYEEVCSYTTPFGALDLTSRLAAVVW